MQGTGGFILSGIRPDRSSDRWNVNVSSDSHQSKILREKMKAKGLDDAIIDAVANGGESEML
jgi:hypothetical protein